jgi:hypothetical protein
VFDFRLVDSPTTAEEEEVVVVGFRLAPTCSDDCGSMILTRFFPLLPSPSGVLVSSFGLRRFMNEERKTAVFLAGKNEIVAIFNSLFQ